MFVEDGQQYFSHDKLKYHIAVNNNEWVDILVLLQTKIYSA